MNYLLLAEISKKQSYIFNSREPQDIVGASIIIRELTQTEFYHSDIIDGDSKIKQGYQNKLIYCGGGGFCLKFKSRDEAVNWNKNYSRTIFNEYPGVEYISVVENDYENRANSNIDDRLKELRKKLADKKTDRSFSFRLHGLGVEKVCEVSGMPVQLVAEDNKNAPSVANEFIAKREKYKSSRDNYYSSLKEEGYDFPSKDDIKNNLSKAIGNSRGDSSLIGLIAIDGNKMGKKVKEFFEDIDKTNDDLYSENYRKFAEEIDKLYRQAMKKTVKVLAKNLNELKNAGLKIKENVIPIVHIVLSGDDISFVVDGRIAIQTAKIFLDELSKIEDGYKACAGVAIANTGYPYWKLSDIAEDLLKNAKSKVAKDDQDACVIDWQLIEGDFDAEQIKNRFTAKPYVIDGTELGDVECTKWNEFANAMDSVKNSDLANSTKNEIFNRIKGQEALQEWINKIKDKDKKSKVEKLSKSESPTLFDALESEKIYQWCGDDENYTYVDEGGVE